MAVVADRVIVDLHANVGRYNADIRSAATNFNRSMQQIGGSAQQMERRVGASFGALQVGLRALSGIGVAAAGMAAIRLADQYTQMQNSLKVAGIEGENLTKTLDDLAAAANRQGAPVSAMVQLYSKMSMSQKELGATSEQMLHAVEGVGAALKVSGTSSEAASGALLQLSQALSGGIVRAEEFNSILEGTPMLARAIAKEVNGAEGSIGKLRQMMIDGALSSKELFDAMERASDQLIATSATMAPTVGQAWTKVGNALVLAAGQMDDLTGASDNLVGALENVAAAIKAIADASVWGFDKVEKFQKLLISMGLIDIEARREMGTSGEGSMVAEAVRKNIEAAIVEQERVSGDIANQISELQFNIAEGIATNMDAANKELERLQDELKRSGEEAERLKLALTGIANIEYDPLTSMLGRMGTSISSMPMVSPTGIPIETARQYVGSQEVRDKDILENLFHAAGVNVDPEMTAWCAAFVNAVLGAHNLPGTGSLAAKSFLDYGTPTETPQVGDIVVLSREGGGHVGFYEGTSPTGQVLVTGGNQGDSVSTVGFDPENVLGYRRLPGVEAGKPQAGLVQSEIEKRAAAGETAAADAKRAADEAARAQKELTDAKDDFEKTLQRENQALDLEIAAITQSTAEAERAAVKQQLTNQLLDAGITITDEYAAAIDALADKAAARVTAQEAFDANEKATQEAMQATIARADEIRSLASDVIGGMVDDLMNGKSAAEAFANALGKIAQKLIYIGINSLVEGLFGKQGSPLGGIFGGLFTIGSPAAASPALITGGLYHSGGVIGAAGAFRMVPAGAFAGASRFHSGGIAGLQPGEVPLIAQAGEGIVPRIAMPDFMAFRQGYGRGGSNLKVSVDLAGAYGDAAIAEMARLAAEKGTRDAITAVRGNVGGWMADDNARMPGSPRRRGNSGGR